MKDKIDEKLRSKRVKRMKSPVVLINKCDLEELKQTVEYRVFNNDLNEGLPKWKNALLQSSRNILRGAIFVYDNTVEQLKN